MNDQDRLFASSESEVERLLLRAGRVRASDGAKRRALAAASGVLVASSLTSTAAAGSAMGGKLVTSAKLASLLSVKWMTVAVVASVGVAAGTVAVHRTVAAHHASSSVEVTATSKRAASVRGQAVQQSAAPTSGPSALPLVPEAAAPGIVAIGAGPTGRPVVQQPPVNTAPVTAAPLAAPREMAVQKPVPPLRGALSVPRDPSLNSPPPLNPALELSLLDEAREAVAAGEPARALSTLNRYKERFSQGALAPEADVLRIEALVKAGDRSAASRVAEALLSANPQSPYRARIESILRTTAP